MEEDELSPQEMSPADLWDKKRREGMSRTEATAHVNGVLRRRRKEASTEALKARDRTPRVEVGDTVPIAYQLQEEEAGSEDVPPVRPASIADKVTRSIAQGMSFGWADEAAAGIRALGPETYREALADERSIVEQARRENPKTALAGEIGGGLLTGGGLLSGARAAAARAVPGIGRVVATGAGAGGLAGAGAADGDVSDRVRGAATGATLGAVTAGVARGVGRVAGTGADVVGIRPTRPRTGVPVRSVQERARDKVVQAIERDEVPLEELQRRASTLTKPETLMELSGANVTGLARGAQSIPSRARAQIAGALDERAEGQMGRVAEDLERGVGVARDDIFQRADDLITARRTNAAPLYDAAFKAPPVTHPAIDEALSLPLFRKAYEAGRQLAEIEGSPIPPLQNIPDWAREAFAGKLPPQAHPVRALDYMKRGLDAVIETGGESGRSMDRGTARALRNRLDEVLAAVDEAVPEYAQARSQFAGDSAMMEALEQGREFLKLDPRRAAREITELSPSEQEVYRLGALDAVRSRMDAAADGRDLTRVIFGNPQARERLRALFPDDDSFAEFAENIASEGRMAQTRNTVLGGSPTARILAEQADLADAPVGEVAQALTTGNPMGLVRTLANSQLANRMRGNTAAVADEVAPYLTAGASGTQGLEEMLEALMQHRARMAEQASRAGAARHAASTQAGLWGGRQ